MKKEKACNWKDCANYCEDYETNCMKWQTEIALYNCRCYFHGDRPQQYHGASPNPNPVIFNKEVSA